MKTLYKSISKILIATSILGFGASSVQADYLNGHKGFKNKYAEYKNNRYDKRSDIIFARVSYSEPIYTYVSKNVKECYEVPVQKKVYNNRDDNYRHSSGYDSNSIGVDTIVGATIGVVIGNQIGKGNGRDAAKIVGGLLGAAVANGTREDRYNNTYQSSGSYSYETAYETRCETKKHHRKEKVISGYKNYFTFNEREYSKLSEHPLRKVRIEHTISF